MRDPDIGKNDGSRAWLVKVDGGTSLTAWLVNRKGAHPLWSWWCVSVVHLRDISGMPPAKKHYPEAEFELMVVAVDPDHSPDPDKAHEGYPLLSPVDVVHQFHGLSDTDAIRLCAEAVEAIVEHRISPDQDFRAAWRTNLEFAIERFRTGKRLSS